MNEVLRQENKFLITSRQFIELKSRLNEIMMPDKHNGDEGYHIRSLYFDTPEDRDFEDKEDGVYLRRKIRLRIYDPMSEYAMLEMKQKQGEYQRKRSLKVSREDAMAMIDGNYNCLLNYNTPFALEVYSLLNMEVYRPKAVVEYNRIAYIARENNTRVTFDFNIIGTEGSYDIFDPLLNQNSLLEQDLIVLEAKYDGFLLSYIKDCLDEVNSSKLSVSKYCLSRSLSKHYRF